MSDYKLMKHSVKTASFAESFERVKKNNLEIEASGNISIPKNEDKNNRRISKVKQK